MKRSMFVAILTDLHFWLPVMVLLFGIGLLVVLSQQAGVSGTGAP